MTKPWYQRCYRRMLVDMHIGDWNEKFLAKYDVGKIVDLYRAANLTSAMFYCQSHVGLCYWPTRTGKMHAGLKGRDIVKEMLTALKAHDIAACGYYSLNFNNWAFLEHPEWRQKSAGASDDGSFAGATSRYGLVCPNHPGYVDFVMKQIDELVGGYEFDGMFYDMTFWPTLCVCEQCRDKYRRQTGCELPATIDWFNEDWCRFQAAREQWLCDFAQAVTDRTKRVRPGLVAYHNYAAVMANWTLGVNAQAAAASDFLGGDFYGDPLDQQVEIKLMSGLTSHQPLEFMTSRCVTIGDHERTKSYEEMEMAALASTQFSAAFLFIDAINLDGTVNPAVYKRIGRIFKRLAAYEPFLGGTQVEDIGVYWSSDARVNWTDNGKTLAQAPMWARDYPHLKAIRGVCRLLQRAHLPYGIINRNWLDRLDQFSMIILPNVMRMDRREVDAVREYVRRGGRIYASRYSSLVETQGVRHADFLLADVFGCHLAADDLGTVNYLNMAGSELKKLISPQKYLSHFGAPDTPAAGCGTLRLAESPGGEVLATLTLPYAKEWGDITHQNWASIHSSPPWQNTAAPAIVLNTFGKGQAVYSAADLEVVDSEANFNLFINLVRRLLRDAPRYSADTHPAVWMTAAHQAEHNRFTVCFLNNQQQLPAIPIAGVPFTLRPPPAKKFTRLLLLPRRTPVPFTTEADGTLHARAPRLKVFEMLMAEYEPHPGPS